MKRTRFVSSPFSSPRHDSKAPKIQTSSAKTVIAQKIHSALWSQIQSTIAYFVVNAVANANGPAKMPVQSCGDDGRRASGFLVFIRQLPLRSSHGATKITK